jgi:hypothetical protein
MAALMRPISGDNVDLKTAIFVRMHRENLPPGTVAMYLDFVETYLPLTPAEQAEFQRRTTPEGDVTMETLEKTWLEEQTERAIERGIAEHAPWADRLIHQGALRAKRESLLLLVRARFGEVPAGMEERLASLDESALNSQTERAATAATIDELLAGL